MIKKVIKSQDEEAKAALSTIAKTISFDVSIDCEAYFEPHANALNATASFSSIEEFEDADDIAMGIHTILKTNTILSGMMNAVMVTFH